MSAQLARGLGASCIKCGYLFSFKNFILPAFSLEMINNSSHVNKRQQMKDAIMEFEQRIKAKPPKVRSDWTLWMAVLYAGTISTTIGYGNIGCITTTGRVVTMVYAVFGIPLFIVVLDRIGTVLLKLLKSVSYVCEDLVFFLRECSVKCFGSDR